MEIWVGTGNKGKVSEMQLLFQKEIPEATLKSTLELPTYSAPPENGATFLDNARIKAKSMKSMKPGVWTFAEDSGLMVDGLSGLPGIHSARYAGPKARDSENVAKLLKMMTIRPMSNRNAKFVCTIVAYSPTGEEFIFEGDMKGTIATAPRGLHGFGYDPVFLPENESKTLAELGSGFKVQNSHRTVAVKKLIEKIKSL